MPQETQLAHRNIRNTALPFRTYIPPNETDPCFVSGTTDILTSIAGYCERRPGFSLSVETTPTTFNNLQRLFTWDRTDGTFYIMACDINNTNQAVVYKYATGVDTSFVSIFTGNASIPFDFVVSNNTVYFANGVQAKKWDPLNGLSNWGITTGSVNNATGPNLTGAGSNGTGSGVNWTNPNNVTSAVSYATVSTTASSPSNPLIANTFGFSIPAANTILGIQITYDFSFTETGGVHGASLSAQLLKNGNPIGVIEFNQPLFPGTYTGLTFGGTADLWGTSWVANDLNQTNWGVQFIASVDSHSPTFSVKNVKATVFGIGGPTIAVSGSVGTMTATAGYTYEFCYGNSNTGHLSSPTPISSNTGTFTNKANVSVQLTASTDPQVNQIRPFRTTDGGGGTYFELPSSPYPNIGWTFTSVANAAAGSTTYTGTPTGASGFASSVGQSFIVAGFTNGANNGTFPCTAATATTITLTNAGGVAETHAATGTLVALDSAADSALQIGSIAPTPTFNDPPTPIRGSVYFAGRIWGFNGNKVYFSGLEEINQGVPEESFPSGLAGNFWTFDQPVTALAITGGIDNQILAIFCPGRIYGITGNTLDTFRRFNISQRRGCRVGPTGVTMLGGMVSWLDTSSTIWVSDGSTMQEISQDIRPNLAGLNPVGVSMTFHVAGKYHWLVMGFGGITFIYDLDTEQWMPPWTVGNQYIYSGETSPGVYDLMHSDQSGTKAYKLNSSGVAGAFNDEGSTYAPVIKTTLMSLVPDFGKRFSYIAMGIYDQPSRTGVPWYFQITNNAKALSDVLILVDDDPTQGTYRSIADNKQGVSTTFNRTNGTFMTQQVYPTGMQEASRWVSLQIKLANADQVDQIYEMFCAYKELGGK